MEKETEELLHQEELKYFLTKDELTLPDIKREELLIQRRWIDRGIISERDLSVNMPAIKKAARKVVASRNKFNFSSWVSTLPEWVMGVIVMSVLFLIIFISDS